MGFEKMTTKKILKTLTKRELRALEEKALLIRFHLKVGREKFWPYEKYMGFLLKAERKNIILFQTESLSITLWTSMTLIKLLIFFTSLWRPMVHIKYLHNFVSFSHHHFLELILRFCIVFPFSPMFYSSSHLTNRSIENFFPYISLCLYTKTLQTESIWLEYTSFSVWRPIFILKAVSAQWANVLEWYYGIIGWLLQ